MYHQIQLQPAPAMAGASKMFARTTVLGASALKYNIPLRYSKAFRQRDSDFTKTLWDLPTAAEVAQQNRLNNFKQYWGLSIILGLIALLPWKYEFGDFKDSIANAQADEMASQSYVSFLIELVGQRNRAYEWYRYLGRPSTGMTDPEQPRPRAPGTQGGFQGWDVTTGKPIHSLEKHGKINMYYDNDSLSKNYITETKVDMDRIRDVCSFTFN